jgi:RNA polymerase sigma-70 factor (ECF subfamily)
MTSAMDPTPELDATVDESADESLLARAARGDQAAYARLYDRYQGMIYGLAVRITGDAALAQDVAQDALVGVWRNAARYVPEKASARTWIMSIAHHRAIDALRRRRPTTELPDPELPPPASMTVPDVWPEVAGRLDRVAVRTALATLSDVQREAIELAYFGGFTQQEIALRTDTPLGTVKSRVRLGLLALGRALADETASTPGAQPPRETGRGETASAGTMQVSGQAPTQTSWLAAPDRVERTVDLPDEGDAT